MTEPTLNYVSCPQWGIAKARGDAAPVASTTARRLAYWQWSNSPETEAGHVVLCVHGLTRQGRDFDVLAQALVQRSGAPLRVICPDVVGRGHSDWLQDPMGYQIPNYAADMVTLLQHLAPSTVDWVGTSMGGLIGMVVAGQKALPLPVSIRRLILNDVGPTVQWSAITRIGQYLGHTGHFDTLEQAAQTMWSISSSFGPHTPEQWLALCRHMVRPLLQGGLTLHYDPAIAEPFKALTPESAAQGDALLWQLYDQITATTLVTRGALSDLLTLETAQAMTGRGPRAALCEFDGVGHAPTFVAADQVDVAARFLLGN